MFRNALSAIIRKIGLGCKDLVASFWRSCLNVFNCTGLATCLLAFAVAIALSSSNGWFDWLAKFIPVLGPAMLAVFKGAITCFLAFCAGFGFCRFNRELIDLKAQKLAEELKKKEAEQENAKIEISKLETDNAKLKDENEDLKKQNDQSREEIDRLKHSSIAVASIKQILKCELIEADMKIKEVYNDWIAGSLKTSHLHRPTAKRFLGVVEKNFKTSLGIDLQKVRVLKLENTLYVSGVDDVEVKAEVPATTWTIEEVKEYKMRQAKDREISVIKDREDKGYVPDESEKEVVTLQSPNEFHEVEKGYDEELNTRIRSPQFEQYNLAIRFAKDASRRLIKMILSPFENVGYGIQFVSPEMMNSMNVDSKSLLGFVEGFVENGVNKIA